MNMFEIKMTGVIFMKEKSRVNLECLEILEEKGWFDIAVNRAYYYIYQTFLMYKESKELNREFEKFKKDQYKMFRKSGMGNPTGSHEIMFLFISRELKSQLGNIERGRFIDFNINFSSLKNARTQADYHKSYKHDLMKYNSVKKIFKEMILES